MKYLSLLVLLSLSTQFAHGSVVDENKVCSDLEILSTSSEFHDEEAVLQECLKKVKGASYIEQVAIDICKEEHINRKVQCIVGSIGKIYFPGSGVFSCVRKVVPNIALCIETHGYSLKFPDNASFTELLKRAQQEVKMGKYSFALFTIERAQAQLELREKDLILPAELKGSIELLLLTIKKLRRIDNIE